MRSPKELALENIRRMGEAAMRQRIMAKARPPAPPVVEGKGVPEAEPELSPEDAELLAQEYERGC